MLASTTADYEEFMQALTLGRHEESGKYYCKPEEDDLGPENQETYYNFFLMVFELEQSAKDSDFKRCIRADFDHTKETDRFLEECKISCKRVLNSINSATARLITGRNKLILAKPGPLVKLTDEQFKYITTRVISLIQASLDALAKKREAVLKGMGLIETVAKSLHKIETTKLRLDVQMGLFQTVDGLINANETSPDEDTLAEWGEEDVSIDTRVIKIAQKFGWKTTSGTG